MPEQYLLILLAIYEKNDKMIAQYCHSVASFKRLLDGYLKDGLVRIEYKRGDQLVFLTDKGIELLRNNNLIGKPLEPVKTPEQYDAAYMPPTPRKSYSLDDYIMASLAAANHPAKDLALDINPLKWAYRVQAFFPYLFYKYIMKRSLPNVTGKKDNPTTTRKDQGDSKNN